MVRKVVILPCSGIGKAAGEIGRQAAYLVAQELRPEMVETPCLARLMLDDPETLEIIRQNQVITLDGCAEDCARKNVERIKNGVDYAVHVSDLMEEYPELKPEGILKLGQAGHQLVERLAERLAAEVDLLTLKGA